MTIARALKKYTEIENDLLLAHVLEKDRVFLLTNPDLVLTNNQIARYTKLCEKRQLGHPIAYLMGFKWFMNNKFIVNEHTLIPRPETEGLVNMVYEDNKDKDHLSILDIGTGSGCIAISLKKLFGKSAEISASDISTEVLEVAKSNAQNLGQKINFINSNLFSEITESYDIIVANLPYVYPDVYKKNSENIKYEPKTAILLPTPDFLSNFITQAMNHSKKIYLEIDPENVLEIEAASKKNSLNLGFHKDSNHLIRYAVLTSLF